MTSELILEPAGILALGRDPGVGAFVKNRTEAVASRARDFAPVDTGAYRDGITTWVGLEDGRIVGRVNANHWTSMFVEFGTSTLPAYRPLGRALDASASY